jgi:hypothetical protein
MSGDEPKPNRVQSAFLWFATISVPLMIGAVIIGAITYVLWMLSHFNID